MTRGVRLGGRSARVVADVLLAAASELATHGYQAFRMEVVASAAGVSRTTVYRRWPTKAELVEAALRQVAPQMPPPNTGSLEGDLVAFLQAVVRFNRTPQGSGLLRTLDVDRNEPDLARIVNTVERDLLAPWMAAIEAGKARGELPESFDPRLLVHMIGAPTMMRLRRKGERIDDATLTTIVRVVLAGARAIATSDGGSASTGARRSSRRL